MSNGNEHDVYIIPPNFIEGGTLFGGMFKLKNAIEAGVLAFAVILPVMRINISLTARIVILCLTALPLGIFGLLGINGECLSSSVDGVYYLGYPLALTPSELAILSYLVKQSPNAVEQDELLSVCVGDSHRKSSVLRQHVSSINKKARTIYGGRDIITSDRKRDGVKHYFMVKYI